MRNPFLFGLALLVITACSDDLLNDNTLVGPTGEPDRSELGQRLVPAGVSLDLEGLSQAELGRVFQGSYLVNGAAGCIGCHNGPAGYLGGGGLEVPFLPTDIEGRTSVISRNLTPDPDTGMKLTEDEFVESMRTGKDFHDHTEDNPQRMIIMPTQAYRYALEDDLRAMYAYLQRIPPIHNEIRREYIPPFPFAPIPAPIADNSDPDGAEWGLQIPLIFSSGQDADGFAFRFEENIAALDGTERAQVGRGSYLVNALADYSNCHTNGDGDPDGFFDSGVLPGTFDINTATYLAGGVNLGVFFQLADPLFSRNLTPHAEHGLKLSEAEFVQTLRFGADFRRPNNSLRIPPHFPAEFHMTLADLRAIYAYLKNVPAIDNEIQINEIHTTE